MHKIADILQTTKQLKCNVMKRDVFILIKRSLGAFLKVLIEYR